jgi:hypothetical protein
VTAVPLGRGAAVPLGRGVPVPSLSENQKRLRQIQVSRIERLTLLVAFFRKYGLFLADSRGSYRVI